MRAGVDTHAYVPVFALTFLCQRGVRFIFVHQQLDLLWFERRVEYLIQTRVSLFTVNKLSHLLHCEVWTTLSPPERRGWGVGKTRGVIARCGQIQKLSVEEMMAEMSCN